MPNVVMDDEYQGYGNAVIQDQFDQAAEDERQRWEQDQQDIAKAEQEAMDARQNADLAEYAARTIATPPPPPMDARTMVGGGDARDGPPNLQPMAGRRSYLLDIAPLPSDQQGTAAGGAPPPSGTPGRYSPFDDVFARHLSPQNQGNPELLGIIAAGSYAESRHNPNAIGDNGHSVGLFQMHDAGAGAGMGAARANPDAASAVMVPRYEAAYNRIKAQHPNLQGADLAAAVAAEAERPAGYDNPSSAAWNNYRQAYNTVVPSAAMQQIPNAVPDVTTRAPIPNATPEMNTGAQPLGNDAPIPPADLLQEIARQSQQAGGGGRFGGPSATGQPGRPAYVDDGGLGDQPAPPADTQPLFDMMWDNPPPPAPPQPSPADQAITASAADAETGATYTPPPPTESPVLGQIPDQYQLPAAPAGSLREGYQEPPAPPPIPPELQNRWSPTGMNDAAGLHEARLAFNAGATLPTWGESIAQSPLGPAAEWAAENPGIVGPVEEAAGALVNPVGFVRGQVEHTPGVTQGNEARRFDVGPLSLTPLDVWEGASNALLMPGGAGEGRGLLHSGPIYTEAERAARAAQGLDQPMRLGLGEARQRWGEALNQPDLREALLHREIGGGSFGPGGTDRAWPTGGGPRSPWSMEHLQGLPLDERRVAADAIKMSETPNADLVPGMHPFDNPGLVLAENRGGGQLEVRRVRGYPVQPAEIEQAQEWAVNRGGMVSSTGSRGAAVAYLPYRQPSHGALLSTGLAGAPPVPPLPPMPPTALLSSGGAGGSGNVGDAILDGLHWRTPHAEPPPLRGRADQVSTFAQRQFLDRNAPLNQLGNGVEQTAELYNGRGGAAQMRMQQAVRPVLDALGQGVAYSEPSGVRVPMQEAFDKYVQLQRDREVADLAAQRGWDPARLNRSGITDPAQADAGLAVMEQRMGPILWQRIQDADALRQQAFNQLLTDKVGAGLISQDTADLLRTTQPHYNPTRFMQADRALRSPGGGLQVNGNTLRRLTEAGQEGDSMQPLGSFAQAMAEGELAIQRNVLKTQIIDTLRNHSVWGPETTRMPATAAHGPLIDVQGDVGTIMTHLDKGVKKDGVLGVMRDGKAEWWELPKDQLIRDAVADLDPDPLNFWQHVLRAGQEMTRLGATSASPAFMISNAVADAIQTTMREGWGTTVRIPVGIWHALARDATYQAAVRNGALEGTSILGKTGEDMVHALQSQLRDANVGGQQALNAHQQLLRQAGGRLATPEEVLRYLMPRWQDAIGAGVGGAYTYSQTPDDDPNRLLKAGLGAAVGLNVRRPLMRANEVIEQGPRLATYAQRVARGETSQQAALAARRVTVDFSRSGEAVKWLSPLKMFLGAQIGGAMGPVRLARDFNVTSPFRILGRDIPRAAVAMPTLALLGAASYMWNRNFPELYNDIPDWAKATGLPWVNPNGWVPDKSGLGYETANWFLMPLREWSAFTSPVIALMEAIDKHDPQILTRGLANAGIGYVPGAARAGDMPIFQTMQDIQANHSTFTGHQITPRNKEGVMVPERVTPQTSAFATSGLGRAIAQGSVPVPLFGNVSPGQFIAGRREGLSPIETDYLVRGWGAGAGRTMLDASNILSGRPERNPNAIPVVSGLTRSVWRDYGGATRDKAYDQVAEAYSNELPGVERTIRDMPGFAERPQDQQDAIWRAADAELRASLNLRYGIPTAATQRDREMFVNPSVTLDDGRTFSMTEIIHGTGLYKAMTRTPASRMTFASLPPEEQERIVMLHAIRGALIVKPEYREARGSLQYEETAARGRVLEALYGR